MWKKIRRETERIGKQVGREACRAGKKALRTTNRLFKNAGHVNKLAEKVLKQVNERMKDPKVRSLAIDTTKKLVRGKLDLQSAGLCVCGFIGIGTTKGEVVNAGLKKLGEVVSRENPGYTAPTSKPNQSENSGNSDEESELDFDALRDALEGLKKSMEDDVDDQSLPAEVIQFRQTYRSIVNVMSGDSVAEAVSESGVWLADVLDDIDNEKLVVTDEDKFDESTQRLFNQWNTLYNLAIRLSAQEKYYDSVEEFNKWPADDKANAVSLSDMSFMSAFSINSRKLVKSIKESIQEGENNQE